MSFFAMYDADGNYLKTVHIFPISIPIPPAPQPVTSGGAPGPNSPQGQPVLPNNIGSPAVVNPTPSVPVSAAEVEKVKKLFRESGGTFDANYYGCWMIGEDQLTKFAEKVVAGGIGEALSAETLSEEAMFWALHDTDGRYQSEQERAAAMLRILKEKK